MMTKKELMEQVEFTYDNFARLRICFETEFSLQKADVDSDFMEDQIRGYLASSILEDVYGGFCDNLTRELSVLQELSGSLRYYPNSMPVAEAENNIREAFSKLHKIINDQRSKGEQK